MTGSGQELFNECNCGELIDRCMRDQGRAGAPFSFIFVANCLLLDAQVPIHKEVRVNSR